VSLLEEKYVDLPRSGHRQRPGKHAAPPRRGRKQKRSPGRRAFWILYTILAVISAFIVAAYLAFQFFVKPPDQTDIPPNPPDSSQDSSASASTSQGVGDPTPTFTRKPEVYNVLLAGTDEQGYRTDTMMVMRYDVGEQTVSVVSVPRDTLIDRGAGKNPRLVYGPGGVVQRVSDISAMLGVPIDYYIKVDLGAFVALVDEVGGVDFNVPCDMDYDDPYQNLSIHYKSGVQHLNGRQAMEVSRFRKNNDGTGYSDVGRTQTQQDLLIALAKKVLSWGSLTRINGFVEIFNDYVDTNLSLSNMLYFASQAIYLQPSTGVKACTLPGNGETTFRGYHYCYTLDPTATLDIVNEYLNPYEELLTLEQLQLPQGT